VGLGLTAALTGVLFAARQLVGLPFAPFDVFDRVARVLPGGMLTFGIDAMVGLIGALSLGPTSTAAKAAEQSLAVIGLLVTGALAGGLLFAVLRRRTAPATLGPGLLAGAIVGLPVALAVATADVPAPAGPLAGAAWTLAAFLVWGAALGRTFRRLSDATAVSRAERRRFLVRLGGATATLTFVGAGVGVWIADRRRRAEGRARGEPWSATHSLPNAGDAVVPVTGTRPELTPVERHYRIDINTRPPVVDEATWRLRFGGLVERPAAFTLADLRARPATDQFVTLECISNPLGGDLIGTQRWTGVPLRLLLDEVRPLPGATHLHLKSADGFHETVAIDEVRADPRVMLTYAWDALPLTADHGFPLRICLPGRYGMKQPKWLVSVEAVDAPEPGYWVQRGWDEKAIMKATSVIDVVSSSMDTSVVPIGGIAFAGPRGISRVAVRVDDGEWQDARLRAPLSSTTWVLWRFDWPFTPGDHVFTVRCWEGDGTPQIAERSPIRPAGASGLDERKAMF
jgi:DMSO/TMAO reductase YedYZ molybdopterin-dependent catalytic subunit